VVREAGIILEQLVVNAFQHGSPPFTVRLAATGDNRSVRLEVDDCGRSVDAGWPLHSGLRLVRALCESWGVERRPGGKTVWGELAVLVPPDDS
jgi:hypothetical protein